LERFAKIVDFHRRKVLTQLYREAKRFPSTGNESEESLSDDEMSRSEVSMSASTQQMVEDDDDSSA